MSTDVAALQKELQLTQSLLELSEALRIRLQRENDALKAGTALRAAVRHA